MAKWKVSCAGTIPGTNPPDSRSHATFPPDDYLVIASKRSEHR